MKSRTRDLSRFAASRPYLAAVLWLCGATASACATACCSVHPQDQVFSDGFEPSVELREYTFEHGTEGFTALFADYPSGHESFYELEFSQEALPEPLTGRRGLRLSGNNHSDDLAMLVKARVDQLSPGVQYQIMMELEMASNVPAGCAGAGGSPGEGVVVKLGATTSEPFAIEQPDGWLRWNFSYGGFSGSTGQTAVVGNMANADYHCDIPVVAPWALRTLSTEGHTLKARADVQGNLWIVAGSDSGFEGTSTWYITRLRVWLASLAPLHSEP